MVYLGENERTGIARLWCVCGNILICLDPIDFFLCHGFLNAGPLSTRHVFLICHAFNWSLRAGLRLCRHGVEGKQSVLIQGKIWKMCVDQPGRDFLMFGFDQMIAFLHVLIHVEL